jgi:hypothetical protein
MNELDHDHAGSIHGGGVVPLCTLDPDDYQIGGLWRCTPNEPFWPPYWA